jgi:predicted metal-dependent hydrolase
MDAFELRVAGAPVAVRRHPRARRLRLRVDDTGSLHLTMPPRASLRSARAFLAEQQDWAARALARVHMPGALGLEEPGTMPLLGERLPLAYREAPRSSVRRAPLTACGPTLEAAALALERWARRETETRAHAIAEAVAPTLGLAVPRLSIRAQRGRWGSASARTGTLALNWRLLLTTEAAFDYVVVHELCHFREMNHSPRFWSLVASLRPDWGTQQRWLRANQAEILRWSPLRALAYAA